MAIEELPVKPSRGGDWYSWGDAVDANVREFVLYHAGLKAQAAKNAAALVSVTAQMDALMAGKVDKTGVATVATTGRYADLIGAPPVTNVLSTSSTTTRPTSDPAVRVIWYTPTPPVAAMLAGDVWEPTA